MTMPLVIIGAGGFGREVQDVVEAVNAACPTGQPVWDLLGFIDDSTPDLSLLHRAGTQHLGGVGMLGTLPPDTRFVIAIGSGATRRLIDSIARGHGLEAATLVHPAATLGRHHIDLGPGSIVCAQVSLTTNIRLGRHVHLNLNTTVGHDCVLGDYVTVSPGSAISGNVRLDDEVMVGTGAAIIQGVTIGRASVIGANAAVVRDIPAGVTAVGVPAKPRA